MSTASLLREPVETKINELLAQMTLEEKVGQTHQPHAFGEAEKEAVRNSQVGSILNATSAFAGMGASPSASAEICNAIQRVAVSESRLKIPLLFGRDVIHGYRTVFPIPLGQAAAWNPELVERAAAVAASEASADGIKWTFAPMVDVARDPRWGRVAEGWGEDPYLASVLSAAAVRGFQGSDFSAEHKIVACAKHYVGYGGVEGGRDYESAEISMRTLRDVYLPPFRAAVSAGVGTLMSAFHDLSGVPMTAHRQLLSEILRQEWGFKGFVVSDWESVAELVNHGIAQNRAEAAALALFAGVDMDMVSGAYLENLGSLVQDGHLPMEILDEAVRRILRIKLLAGLFDNPYTDPRKAASQLVTRENRNAARLLAQQSIVLLKNEADILPFENRFRRVAILGPLAHSREELFGAWAPDGRPEETITIAEAFKEIVPRGMEFIFADSVDEAIRAIRLAEVAVVVLGEHPNRSGENASVADLSLPPGQKQFLGALAAQAVPVVLVVLAGRPLAIPDEINLARAALYAWHPGIEGGRALAELILGLANPSGKLPITIPRATGQVPVYYGHKNSGRPIGYDQFTHRYVDLAHGPLYPFGYGLSYTRFQYDNLSISSAAASGPYDFSAEVTNTGQRPGSEVVQLYVRDLVASVARPVKELKGFQRLTLKPGETRRAAFTLKPADLTFTGLDELPRLEAGEFKVWIGPSSVEGLEGSFGMEL